MDADSIRLIFILIVLVFLSGFFSATETAMSSLNILRLKTKAEAGNKSAQLTLRLVEDYESLISCILIANNIINLSAASIGTVLFTKYFLVHGATISTVVLTIAILIFGEITPKTIAKANAEKFAMFSAPLMRVCMFILKPLNFVFSKICSLATRFISKDSEMGISEEELITMVSEAENEGGLDEYESKLIRAAIEFNDLEVEEILIPRVDILAVDKCSSMENLARLFAESGYSRLPVFENAIDNIIGIIHEKDFYAARYRDLISFEDYIKEVNFCTKSTKISALLRILQRSKSQMAVVIDEYGGTAGLVTLEDILEELVGEIYDEHDEILEQFLLKDDGSYLVSASASLDDLFDRFSLKEETTATSIGAWVLEHLKAIPKEGDSFAQENIKVTVWKVENRRILEIRVNEI